MPTPKRAFIRSGGCARVDPEITLPALTTERQKLAKEHRYPTAMEPFFVARR